MAALPRLIGLAALLVGTAIAAQAPRSEVGQAIYRAGRLADGQPLLGERAGQVPLRGQEAACVQCHRRSGFGSVEGEIVVPPIAGRFLFQPGQRIPPQEMHHADAAHMPASPPDRPAYDEAALARAIRDGIGPDGRRLNYLMPRFELDDASMRELIGYLRGLSRSRVPGVTDSTLHLATIVTPDADPIALGGMLQVLQHFAEDNNASFFRGGGSLQLTVKRVHVQREWQLHLWQLEGAPETWEAQLTRHLRTEPVFAVISGLGGTTWEPVHRFCEREGIPCLLPNVDLPVVADDDFYPVYFSQGVLLEARLIAQRLSAQVSAGQGRRRIVQIYRAGDIGAAAAAGLRKALGGDADLVERTLGAQDGPSRLAEWIDAARDADAVVLWLRPDDLKSLPAPAPSQAAVFVSGVMGGLEQTPLAPAWRSVARIVYPYELPRARSLRLNYPLGWFHLRGIAVVAERVQVDTYIACSVLAETLASMRGDFERDYLIERIETMLGSRLVDGYYEHLSLAPGQRFASKGGYLVRFTQPSGPDIVADGGWTVP